MEIAFSSADPGVLAEWEAASERYRVAYAAAFVFAFEFGALPIRMDRGHEIALVGVQRKDSPGKEWRWNKRLNAWTPDKRTKAGRSLDERMGEIVAKGQRRLPGMPDIAFNAGRWYTPEMGVYDGMMWVAWACPIEVLRDNAWSNIKTDERRWIQRPLSEFYAAKEAAVVGA